MMSCLILERAFSFSLLGLYRRLLTLCSLHLNTKGFSPTSSIDSSSIMCQLLPSTSWNQPPLEEPDLPTAPQTVYVRRATASARITKGPFFPASSISPTGRSGSRGINRCDLLLGQLYLVMLLEHGAHVVVVSSWFYKDYSDIAVKQLNIILCRTLKKPNYLGMGQLVPLSLPTIDLVLAPNWHHKHFYSSSPFTHFLTYLLAYCRLFPHLFLCLEDLPLEESIFS